MAKFITIGYGDQSGYDRTPADLRNAAHAADADLLKRGALIGIAGKPTQVRNTESKGVDVAPASFMSSPLPIAGFAVFDAADLNEAIEISSRAPCAVCHGVVEVWPLEPNPEE